MAKKLRMYSNVQPLFLIGQFPQTQHSFLAHKGAGDGQQSGLFYGKEAQSVLQPLFLIRCLRENAPTMQINVEKSVVYSSNDN